jgi:hypothetical protein
MANLNFTQNYRMQVLKKRGSQWREPMIEDRYYFTGSKMLAEASEIDFPVRLQVFQSESVGWIQYEI